MGIRREGNISLGLSKIKEVVDMASTIMSRSVSILVGEDTIEGDLNIPQNSRAIVIFAHGSGSGRHSPRNKYVAEVLNAGAISTLLMDLLTPSEEAVDMQTAHLRFDIPFLADRLVRVTDWVRQDSAIAEFSVGYFGASTGAAAALVAAAIRADVVKAVVSRGGRPDLAGSFLLHVRAPTLLIVGGNDKQVIELNYAAAKMLQTQYRVEIIPGAGHLFEEPGTLDKVALLAREWFETHLIMRSKAA